MKLQLSSREIQDIQKARRRRNAAHGKMKCCKPILSRNLLVLMVAMTSMFFTVALYFIIMITERAASPLIVQDTPYQLSAASLANRDSQGDPVQATVSLR